MLCYVITLEFCGLNPTQQSTTCMVETIDEIEPHWKQQYFGTTRKWSMTKVWMSRDVHNQEMVNDQDMNESGCTGPGNGQWPRYEWVRMDTTRKWSMTKTWMSQDVNNQKMVNGQDMNESGTQPGNGQWPRHEWVRMYTTRKWSMTKTWMSWDVPFKL